MAKIKLTQKSVAAAVCPAGKKDVLIFDADLKGFGLRVTAGGSKIFLAQYNVAAGKRRDTLGRFGTLTVDQARREANKVLSAAAGGSDPVAEKRAKAAATKVKAQADAFTVEKLIEEWRAHRSGDRRESYLKNASSSLRNHLKPWLNRPASTITAREAQRVLDTVKATAGAISANRILSYGRAAFNWALKRQLLDFNPFAGRERPAREQARDRVLDANELGAIFRAAATLPPPYGAFVKVLMLTLSRRQEVASMWWPELSADRSTWTLPAERAKNAKAHVVHLAEPVRAILADQKPLSGCVLVFPSERATPISAFSDAKERLDKAIMAEGGTPLAGWTFHDFRRAGVTYLAHTGTPPHVADKLLNHVGGTIQGVAKVYNLAEFREERAAALDRWAAHVVAAAEGIEPASNVVPLARAAG